MSIVGYAIRRKVTVEAHCQKAECFCQLPAETDTADHNGDWRELNWDDKLGRIIVVIRSSPAMKRHLMPHRSRRGWKNHGKLRHTYRTYAQGEL